MPTAAENLITRRDAICSELAALTSSKAGGAPNTSGGESMDHVGYKDGLYRELDKINQQLAQLGGDWELSSEVY